MFHRFSQKSRSLVCAAALLAAVGSASAAQNAREAYDYIYNLGYSSINDLKLSHGYWSAEATTWGGKRVQLLLDQNNQLVEVGNLASNDRIATATEVVAHLQNLGYRNVHDVELDDGFWEAEAINLANRKVNLVLHPVTLALIGEVVDGYGETIDVGTGSTILSAAQVRAYLEQAGYTYIHDLEFDDGYWEADAINAAGQSVDLIIDPRTGQVVRSINDDSDAGNSNNSGSGKLTAAQIRTALEAAGYTRIHDLELDDGYWEAEAWNAAGNKVELKIDPNTGKVIREKIDR